MRIVLINTKDKHGGAARAAFRLHKGLCAIGADSTYYVQQKTVDDPTVQQFIPDPSPDAIQRRQSIVSDLRKEYDTYAATRSSQIELFSQERVDDDDDVYIQRPRADVINLHWVSGFIDLPLFFSPKRTRCPVVWTLHDMNAFTGGCHYDQHCGKYNSQCQACPLLGSQDQQDLSHRVFESKGKLLDQWPAEKLHIVAPSKWLAQEAKRSTLLSKFDSTVIPNSIETDVFAPIDKLDARKQLDLPVDAKIVLFVSNHIGLARKGFRELVQALALMPNTDNLMLLGVGDSHVLDIEAPFRVGQLPFVNDDHTAALMYSAADVTAIPSRQDNLPNTILESMSCGTPVVGFEVGGIPDVVLHRDNGFLARPGNVADMALAFTDALSDEAALRACGERARQLMERSFSLTVQGEAYNSLFEAVIERFKNSGKTGQARRGWR